jgi:uncharacterized small protein (DUF1192 family)
MKNAMKGDTVTYIEAGLEAVQLLHKLFGLTPLRSDTKSIQAEIARIELAFRAPKKGAANAQFRRSA